MIKLDVYWAHFFVHITITEEQITMTQEKKHRGLFWGIALVVLIVVLLFVWWSNQSVGKQISYSEFETMVQNNQIEYVYGVGGTFKVKEYKSGDTPSEENFWKFANKLYFCSPITIFILGVTGFDSEPRWYVSMRSDDCGLHNHVGQKINWRNKVRSRCLNEVQ